MTFRDWVVSRCDEQRITMAELAAQLGWGRRTLYRKIGGKGLTLEDMQKVQAVSEGAVTFDEFLQGAVA